MKIGICNDHAGVEYKNDLVAYLTGKGYEMVNFGTDTTASMDYPDVAHKLAAAVENGEVDLGIAFCGTGNGMQMSLNKHQGIRAGLCCQLRSENSSSSTTMRMFLSCRHVSSHSKL